MVDWKKLSNRDNYSISEHGEVRNDKTGKVLKNSLDGKGYARVSLSNGTKKVPTIVFPHREVARLFIDNPENLPVVNHKNGIKSDPRKNNLEWTTNKGNTEHSIRTGLWDPVETSKKANQASLLVNSKPIKAIKSDKSETIFNSISEASREFGLHQNSIRRSIDKNVEVKSVKFVLVTKK